MLGVMLMVVDNLGVGDSLSRSTYGEGEKKEILFATLGESREQESIEVLVSEQKYSLDQVELLQEEVWELILKELHMGQGDLEYTTKSIVLPEKIEGYPFDIK